MANKLGSLLVQLAADTALLQKDMGKASGIVNSNAKRMSAAMDTVKRSFAGILSVVAVQRAFKAVISATAAQEEAMRQLEARIKSTGNAVGLTAKQIADSASKFQAASTFGDEAILDAQTRLIQFGNIVGQTFFDATQAALDLSAAMKTDLGTSALLVGRALSEPVKGLTRLTRVGVSFTDQQKEQIKQMVKVGDTAGAQKIVLEGLTKATGGAAKAARDTLGGALEALRNTMGDLIENDSAGLPALTKAINDLNTALADPAVKQAIDQFTSAMIDGLTWVAENGPTVVRNIDTISDAIVNLGKAFIVFKAASFGLARGGPIGGVLLGTLSALELFKADIGKFLATPEVKRLLEISEQSDSDKNAALKAALGPVANPSGLVVKIGAPTGGATLTPQSPTIDKEAAAAEKRRVDSIQNIIDRLKDEQATLGKGKSELIAYQLAVLNASPAQIAFATALAQSNEAGEAAIKAAEDQKKANEELTASVQEIIESLFTEEEAIRTSAERRTLIVELAADRRIITEQRAAEIIAGIYEKADKDIVESNEKKTQELMNAAGQLGQAFTSAFDDAIIAGAKFGDILKGLLEDIARIALRVAVTAPLEKALSGVFAGVLGSAQGNVFSGGNVIPFARGGIVSRPTIFPMAKGAGLMGEAGPEAIMPLRRMPGGDLGVSGSGTVVQVIDQRGTQSAPVDVQRQMVAGREQIRVLIRDQVEAAISGGALDRAMASSFGIRRSGAR